ncbi:MFS transporter [Pseudomonas sp. 10B1]|uniref:MFS transporter n=1 Tax=unclassified Pseudomonas TaxID=196821 RepID=UPI002AB50E26|nr:MULTISPECIES: MFS transporter [unclassified Pseudomonas]MDY7563338.1 MFS transporter [Pseudomonas sp. AB6]MEA9979528.1 MFS transporter [Pseudomonas sp. RTS4]MEA9995195.1 MFS transporter [Pseudomonas sp. AA4]MEB0086844.1 MFS transporter [Pseudomonas sp. RTI1]MEB0127305.1 MFS transporter [Pseudomonas sp. CCC1.2]
MIWQVTQTLWVGGLVLLHLAMLTVLDQTGLAPLLIDEVANLSGTLLVGFAAFCVALQMVVLVQAERFSSLWLDARGQLLMIATLASASHYVLYRWLPDAVRWQLVSYLVLALSGLLLVIQPVPGGNGRACDARP